MALSQCHMAFYVISKGPLLALALSMYQSYIGIWGELLPSLGCIPDCCQLNLSLPRSSSAPYFHLPVLVGLHVNGGYIATLLSMDLAYDSS